MKWGQTFFGLVVAFGLTGCMPAVTKRPNCRLLADQVCVIAGSDQFQRVDISAKETIDVEAGQATFTFYKQAVDSEAALSFRTHLGTVTRAQFGASWSCAETTKSESFCKSVTNPSQVAFLQFLTWDMECRAVFKVTYVDIEKNRWGAEIPSVLRPEDLPQQVNKSRFWTKFHCLGKEHTL
ncbi:hypothetical protein [Asticcacaulis sp. 201]|uniref:hypothetical protein n=1 Tax=Asticcacaulis sp. 201 TaxID=3028787 RepID=UPI002915F578|nr:hypothetical protein [Asticcacaulis sp. 201]MDV6330001.1 hypothetical protein [Asticcacaulis sp. 201]